MEGWGEGFLAFFITYLGKPVETLADLKGRTRERSEEGRFIPFVCSSPRECGKAHEGDSWSLAHRFSAATVVKATESDSSLTDSLTE